MTVFLILVLALSFPKRGIGDRILSISVPLVLNTLSRKALCTNLTVYSFWSFSSRIIRFSSSSFFMYINPPKLRHVDISIDEADETRLLCQAQPHREHLRIFVELTVRSLLKLTHKTAKIFRNVTVKQHAKHILLKIPAVHTPPQIIGCLPYRPMQLRTLLLFPIFLYLISLL